MCEFLGGWLKRNGDILMSEYTQSHRLIAILHGLKDTNGKLLEIATPFEFKPSTGKYGDPENYAFEFHETPRPEWATDEIVERAVESLRAKVRAIIVREPRPVLVGGPWILADGAKVDEAIRAQIIVMYGTSSIGTMCDTSSVGKMCGTSSIGTMYDTSSVGKMCDTSSVGKMYGTSSIGTMYGTSSVGTDLTAKKVSAK